MHSDFQKHSTDLVWPQTDITFHFSLQQKEPKVNFTAEAIISTLVLQEVTQNVLHPQSHTFR